LHRSDPPSPQPQNDRLALRVRDEEDILSRRLWVEVDARPPGEADPLHERAVLVTDQEDERAARLRIIEPYIDLAGGRVEPHLHPDGRHRVEDEVPREVLERDGHALPRPPERKSLAATQARESARLNRTARSAARWQRSARR